MGVHLSPGGIPKAGGLHYAACHPSMVISREGKTFVFNHVEGSFRTKKLYRFASVKADYMISSAQGAANQGQGTFVPNKAARNPNMSPAGTHTPRPCFTSTCL